MYTLQGYPVDLDQRRRLARQRADWRRRQAEAVKRLARRTVLQPVRRAA